MIDEAKLDALEHQLRNRRFDGLAPELIEVIGLARSARAAQAAPGEVQAAWPRRAELLAALAKLSNEVLGSLPLPSPQVTLEEVYSLIMKHEKSTFGHIAWPRLLADRILSLFDGRAK